MLSLPLTVMLLALVATTIMGFPVGLALFGSGVLYFLVAGKDASFAGELVLHGLLSSFVLLAVPLFILAGNFLNRSGLTRRLVDLASVLTGRMRGGLAQISVTLSALMGGVSGSAYLVAGLGMTVLKRGNVLVVPIRTGVGARLGVNVGYLKMTPSPTWNPF